MSNNLNDISHDLKSNGDDIDDRTVAMDFGIEFLKRIDRDINSYKGLSSDFKRMAWEYDAKISALEDLKKYAKETFNITMNEE